MSVFIRGGVWHVNCWVKDSQGKSILVRKSTGKKTRAEALQVEALLLAASGGRDKQRISSMLNLIYNEEKMVLSFEMLWSFYLQEIKRKIIGQQLIRERMSQFFKFADFCKDRNIFNFYDVSRQLAVDYIDFIANLKIKGKTINGYRSNLITVINAVMVRANLSENVFSFTTTVDMNDSKGRRDFSNDELELIYTRCLNFGWGLDGVFLFLLYTGLRLGDVVSLKRTDIINDVIFLLPAKTNRYKIEVKIPLHEKLIKWLNKNVLNSDLLFPQIFERFHNSKIVGTEYIFRDLKNNDSYMIGWHCFRHTMRSKIAAVNGGLDVAKKLLGHSTDSMSLRYNHDVSQLKMVIDKL